jgi:predicted nucleic acid-binding protein
LVISVPLVLEYEGAALRQVESMVYNRDEVGEMIDYLCGHAEATPIYYLWRPLLSDPKDDMVLEAAVAGRCDTIVTFNVRDFVGSDTFGVRIQRPNEFLQELKP